jgi:hypothetical protein
MREKYVFLTRGGDSGNLQVLEISFWSGESSFDIVGDAICGLQKLRYLSFRQAVLFPNRYTVVDDPMNDAVFVKIAASCKSLQDLYLGHFLGITNATWKVPLYV